MNGKRGYNNYKNDAMIYIWSNVKYAMFINVVLYEKYAMLCVSLEYWLRLLFNLFISKCFQIKKVMEQERKLLFNFYSFSSMFRTFSFLQ